MNTKKCNKCGREQKLSLYGKDVRNKDGLQGICEDCRRAFKQRARDERINGKNIIPIESKVCNRCGIEKKSEEFYRDAGISNGRSTICKACRGVSSQRWRENNREHYNAMIRKYNKKHALKLRLHRYKLTVEDYQSMLSAQDGKCKICEKPAQGKRPLVVDHCHKTGRVRGLLCYGCNRALHILETSNLLESAKKYLQFYRH